MSETLIATASPSNALNKSVTWSSSYTQSSGYYKITYAKAEDGDSITIFR